MKILRELQDKQYELLFKKGRPLEKFFPLYEANDTFLYTPGHVTHGPSHVRDGIDLKRMMITVVAALGPCMLWAMYNTGRQAALAVEGGAEPYQSWQTALFHGLGWGYDHTSILGCLFFGALFYIPVYFVTLAAGGLIEALFAVVRKHEISEGFLVTSALFPLTLPPTIPLWQVAIGILFGVFVGKEIFGGVGMNFLNPALTGRAFLFFAYPGQISGDKVWIAASTSPDTYSGATLLGRAAVGAPAGDAGVMSGLQAIHESGFTWWDAFVGFIPGSMGETSTLFCLFGAAVLILTGVGSWRTMLGGVAGLFAMSLLFNAVGSTTNPMFDLPFWWHMVIGGFAFAIVFMATDPVSSAFTNTGKLIYGFCIGCLGALIRVINPAFPEGWMLAILFMNMFAPLIDYFLVQANVKRRQARYAAT
jgi:Na+-transporting NADH:ubiquinone oxidoreductase subunit B